MKTSARLLIALMASLALLPLMQTGCGGGGDSDSSGSDAVDTSAIGTTNSDGTVNVATTNSSGVVTLGLLQPITGAITWKPGISLIYSATGSWRGSWTTGAHSIDYTMSLSELVSGAITGTYKETTGMHGNVSGSRSGKNISLTSPLSDGTVLILEGTFSDTTHITGNIKIQFTDGTSDPYNFSMSK